MFLSYHIRCLTFGRWLHGDLVTEVTSACSGHSSSPDQVLLPMVEVRDSVEQQLWISFILTGQLRRNTREEENVHLRFNCRIPLEILATSYLKSIDEFDKIHLLLYDGICRSSLTEECRLERLKHTDFLQKHVFDI